jgi:hypothetical protein
VEVNGLTVWATERQHLSNSKFILSGFRFRKSSSPRFFSGGPSTEGPPPGLSVFILFVLIIVTIRDILIGLFDSCFRLLLTLACIFCYVL